MAFSPCISFHNNVLYHRLSQPQRRPEAHHPPIGDVQIELTINIKFMILHHDHILDRYYREPISSQETLRFDHHLLESNPDQVHQRVASKLTRLGFRWHPESDNIIRQIKEEGLLIRKFRSNMGRQILPFRSQITGMVAECIPYVNDLLVDETAVMRTIVAESEAEFEANNYGMVPAKSSSINIMLNKVKCEDDQDCIICLNTLKRYAARMPCSHTFHFKCIKTWLKQSHKCPIYRFEMPT